MERSFWKNAALSAIPDLLIAWALMKCTDGGVETFFFTLIALQAAYFTLWAKRSIWSWTLADYGFRVVTAPNETYRRSIEQTSRERATAYASLIDKFERECVPDLLAEADDDKERRFENQQNRYHTIWSNYPAKR